VRHEVLSVMTGDADQFYGAVLAEVHDEGFGAPARAAADHLLTLLGGAAASSARVLDLGCGSGIAAERLADAGCTVRGVDPYAEMLERARLRAPAARFARGSIHDPTPLPACDAVLIIGEIVNYEGAGVPSLAALDAILQRVAAALAPGGVLLMDAAGPGRGGSGPAAAARQVGRWTVEATAVEAAGRLERTVVVRDEAGEVAAHEVHRLVLLPPEEVEETLARAGFVARRLPSDQAWTQGAPSWWAWEAVLAPALDGMPGTPEAAGSARGPGFDPSEGPQVP
jgi:SAM-dependent methyltransferase